MEKTYTIHNKDRDLQAELVSDRTLRPVYLRETREGKNTRLLLSRNEGGLLYCVSNRTHGDLLEYFRDATGPGPDAEVPPDGLQESTKRKKQGSLFSFIKHQ